jgi:hypothetical protein
MRDEDTVYWVGDVDDGSHEGYSTSRITLLLGTEVMEVPGVMIMENDFDMVQGMWEENLEQVEAGEEGYALRQVTVEEANRLYAGRFYLHVEDEARNAGHAAYHAEVEYGDNPHVEDSEEHWDWSTGWERAYAEDNGRDYDSEEDDRQERRQYRADLAASKATLARWYHEELALA